MSSPTSELRGSELDAKGNRKRLVPRFPQNTIGDSMTQQHFADDCNLSLVVDRWMKTGTLLNSRPTDQLQYIDAAAYGDLQQSMNSVIQAQEVFDNLPAKIRRAVGGDPLSMINFLQTATDDELVSLGLAPAPSPSSPLAEPLSGTAGAAQGSGGREPPEPTLSATSHSPPVSGAENAPSTHGGGGKSRA